ncbi:flagellar hook-length control protein FliK [Methylobacterium sp. JK268]
MIGLDSLLARPRTADAPSGRSGGDTVDPAPAAGTGFGAVLHRLDERGDPPAKPDPRQELGIAERGPASSRAQGSEAEVVVDDAAPHGAGGTGTSVMARFAAALTAPPSGDTAPAVPSATLLQQALVALAGQAVPPAPGPALAQQAGTGGGPAAGTDPTPTPTLPSPALGPAPGATVLAQETHFDPVLPVVQTITDQAQGFPGIGLLPHPPAPSEGSAAKTTGRATTPPGPAAPGSGAKRAVQADAAIAVAIGSPILGAPPAASPAPGDAVSAPPAGPAPQIAPQLESAARSPAGAVPQPAGWQATAFAASSAPSGAPATSDPAPGVASAPSTGAAPVSPLPAAAAPVSASVAPVSASVAPVSASAAPVPASVTPLSAAAAQQAAPANPASGGQGAQAAAPAAARPADRSAETDAPDPAPPAVAELNTAVAPAHASGERREGGTSGQDQPGWRAVTREVGTGASPSAAAPASGFAAPLPSAAAPFAGPPAAASAAPAGTVPQLASALAAQLGPPDTAAAGGPLRILTLQLKPAELGSVVVTMRLRDGQLEMNLKTSRAESADLLRKDADVLTGLLREAGYRPDALTIQSADGQGGAASGFSLAGGGGSGAAGGQAAFGGAQDQPARRQSEAGGDPRGSTRRTTQDETVTQPSPGRSGVYL